MYWLGGTCGNLLIFVLFLYPAASTAFRAHSLRSSAVTSRAIPGRGHPGRHNLYDFTISARKSVSIMTALGGDERLIQAHQKAVAEALKELECYAGTRVRQARRQRGPHTGNLVLAICHHDTDTRSIPSSTLMPLPLANMSWTAKAAGSRCRPPISTNAALTSPSSTGMPSPPKCAARDTRLKTA
jgi:hypothetical protein